MKWQRLLLQAFMVTHTSVNAFINTKTLDFRQIGKQRSSKMRIQAFDPLTGCLQVGAALSTYSCLVYYFDRPRGELLVELDKDVKVGPSQVAGLGLFASRNLSKGTILGTYPGTIVPLQQNISKLRQFPACEAYIWRFSDNSAVLDPTDENGMLPEVCTGANHPDRPISRLIFKILPVKGVPSALCRINEPSRGFDVNVVTDEDRKKQCVLMTVERDIYEGEELFMDYGLSYDRSQYGS